MEVETMTIGEMRLEWSKWINWNDILKFDGRKNTTADVPKGKKGVYEAKYRCAKKRLTIGKTRDLRKRIVSELVKGTGSHSAGEKIRRNEDVSRIIVRFAPTDRPSAVEEELHMRHEKAFGSPPKYVEQT